MCMHACVCADMLVFSLSLSLSHLPIIFPCLQSEDDDEEMPREARLRMRNLGKDTPTSSGPNSFGKTARGFTDTVGVYKREQTWS